VGVATRKQPPARLPDVNIVGDTREDRSKTHNYDLDSGERRSLRKEAWTRGFLKPNGKQIPLFIRPAQQTK
jgi:hypothetical protein